MMLGRIALVMIVLACSQRGAASAQDVSPIVLEAVVDAPVDTVWAAWATSEGLRAWLAPHADIDLRIDGLMRANYNADGKLGDAQTIANRVLSFDPARMLSIQVAAAPAGFPFPNAIREMWTVVYLEPAGPDRTTVRIVSHGFSAGEESQRMRAFFQQGNRLTIQQLQRYLAARP